MAAYVKNFRQFGMYALCVLRAHLGAFSAENTAAVYDLRLAVDVFDRLHGAFPQAFIAVLALGVFEFEIGKHTPFSRSADEFRDDFVEEILGVFGFHGVIFAVHENAHAVLAAPAYAERAAEIDLAFQVILCDEVLEFLHYLPRALDVAGTADANRYFYHLFIPACDFFIRNRLRRSSGAGIPALPFCPS